MQGTLLNTITFSGFVDLIRKTWVMREQRITPNARQLFIRDDIGNGQGNTKRYDEMDTQTFARLKLQAEAAKKASIGTGYTVTMTKKRIAMEIDITQEMRDENRYAEVGTLITNLTSFPEQRIELDLTHRFTFCSSTSYVDMDGATVDLTAGDGLAVVYNAHTLKFSASTWSNRVSGDPIFGRGGMEVAEGLTTTAILSNFGERRVITFNTIVTGDDPNTVNSVRQFMGSNTDVDQNNANVLNPYQNKYRHVVLPYLATTALGAADSTKRRWWFLVAAGLGVAGWQAYFGVWENPHLKDQSTDERGSNHDYSRDVWTFGVRAGYGICVVSGRGLIGSLPTS